MVLEKEAWMKMSPDTIQVISFAGLFGDMPSVIDQSNRSADSVTNGAKDNIFSDWINRGNPFLLKLAYNSKDCHNSKEVNGNEMFHCDKFSPRNSDTNLVNGNSPVSEEEDEDLLADFIDEDSQLPSRISKPNFLRIQYSHYNDKDLASLTGSSLCVLRLIEKYARLMQKLEIVNAEFFKGICQLFAIFFHFIYQTFGQHSAYAGGKGPVDSVNFFCSDRLKKALSRITLDCDQGIKPHLVMSSPTSLTSPFSHTDGMLTYNYLQGTSIGLKERCAGADTVSLVARILHKSKSHLQSMLSHNNLAIVEEFYVHLVDVVPDLVEHIHKTTARLLLHINGYADRISSAKWEVKEIGFEHNGYVDLLLGEFKHYKTRLVHGGINKEVQERLLEYGLEIVSEILVEGLSRVKRCTDEGRALMSLDIQVLINGLQHFVLANVKPKLQAVETFIKAYYLPETEFLHWARSHPEYNKNQIARLINLVATMKGWKRKNRLEMLENIE